jgi:hypothetical protein
MKIKDHDPNVNAPKQSADEPRGDRGSDDKTWSPETDDQGILNRVEDEDDNEFEDDEDDSEDEEAGEEDLDDSE